MTDKEREDRKKLFIDLLFTDVEAGGASGNADLAKELAGYAESTRGRQLLDYYAKEIEEATKKFFSQVAPESAFSILSLLRNPAQIGGKEKLAAAKDLLDRAGFVKTEKLEVGGSGGLFILPPKKSQHEDDEE